MKYKRWIAGKMVVIEEWAYKKLLQRFNHVMKDGREKKGNRIDIPCPLCEEAGPCCKGCTFRKFESRLSLAGCSVALARLGVPIPEFVEATENAMRWPADRRNEARAWLKAVYEELLKFEEV